MPIAEYTGGRAAYKRWTDTQRCASRSLHRRLLDARADVINRLAKELIAAALGKAVARVLTRWGLLAYRRRCALREHVPARANSPVERANQESEAEGDYELVASFESLVGLRWGPPRSPPVSFFWQHSYACSLSGARRRRCVGWNAPGSAASACGCVRPRLSLSFRGRSSCWHPKY
jgi:hypothetical protein